MPGGGAIWRGASGPVTPVWKVKSNVSSVGPSSKRNIIQYYNTDFVSTEHIVLMITVLRIYYNNTALHL